MTDSSQSDSDKSEPKRETPPSREASFWAELKRRKVTRVAITYAVVAWLLIQVSATVFPMFDIPIWATRLVTLLLLVGFPVAIILAWAFELSPDGIKATKSVRIKDPDTASISSAKKERGWPSILFAAGVPALIFGVLALVFFFRSGDEFQPPSVAADGDRRVWATQQLLEINRLQDLGEHDAAFTLATEAVPLLAEDTVDDDFWYGFSWSTDIDTEPSGARVYRQAMDTPEDEWGDLGTAPIQSVRFAKSEGYRLRFELEGYREVEILQTSNGGIKRTLPKPFNPVRLDPIDVLPEAMVRIAGFTSDLVDYADFFMDRFEISNRDFERFVSAGAYRNRELWTYPFARDGAEVPWEEAVSSFVDQTGRPGPSTWVGGAYPSAQGDYPVSGLSWYEAAAYARFMGKELPTAAHYRRARRFYSKHSWLIASRSNLGGDGSRPVGENRAMNSLGLYDLDGNVREWCWNEAGTGLRATMGGAWPDAPYHVAWVIPKSPWDRDSTLGFRLVQTFDGKEKLARLQKPIKPRERSQRDYSKEEPVSDAEFMIYKRMYAYDSLPLNAEVVTADSFEYWDRERVAFDLPYGERGGAILYIPKNAAPPYSAVIHWPGAGYLRRKSFDEEGLSSFDYLVRSGRAVILPILKGSYNRDGSNFSTTLPSLLRQSDGTMFRDYQIKWVQDLSRTIDYLETREDIDSDRVGYYGISWGGSNAPLVLAVENRIDAAVVNSGGLWMFRFLPEIDPVNFLAHVRSPILMLNGKYDLVFPMETSQKPMFEFLGTDPQHKKFISNPSAHFTPRNILIRETLDWFDRYLEEPGKR